MIRIDLCDYCQQAGANSQCCGCNCAYYCNAECQKKHWKEHRVFCLHIQQENCSRDLILKDVNKFMKTYNRLSIDSCGLCKNTSEPKSKMQLFCGHVICINCIAVTCFEKHVDFACPQCNYKGNVVEDAQVLYKKLINRAYNCLEQGKMDQCFELARVAEEQHNRLKILRKSMILTEGEKVHETITIQMVELSILYLLGKYEECISLGNTLLAHPLLLHCFPLYFIVFLRYIDAKSKLGRHHECYDDLAMIYEKLQKTFEDFERLQSTNPANLITNRDGSCSYIGSTNHLGEGNVFFGSEDANGENLLEVNGRVVRECFFLKDYTQAIILGEEFLQVPVICRSEFVYEYVARSYGCLGQYEEGIATMKKAIRYKAPWNTGRVEMYKRLLAELEEQRAKESGGRSGGQEKKEKEKEMIEGPTTISTAASTGTASTGTTITTATTDTTSTNGTTISVKNTPSVPLTTPPTTTPPTSAAVNTTNTTTTSTPRTATPKKPLPPKQQPQPPKPNTTTKTALLSSSPTSPTPHPPAPSSSTSHQTITTTSSTTSSTTSTSSTTITTTSSSTSANGMTTTTTTTVMTMKMQGGAGSGGGGSVGSVGGVGSVLPGRAPGMKRIPRTVVPIPPTSSAPASSSSKPKHTYTTTAPAYDDLMDYPTPLTSSTSTASSSPLSTNTTTNTITNPSAASTSSGDSGTTAETSSSESKQPVRNPLAHIWKHLQEHNIAAAATGLSSGDGEGRKKGGRKKR